MPTSSKDESREKMTLRKPHPLGWGAVITLEYVNTLAYRQISHGITANR